MPIGIKPKFKLEYFDRSIIKKNWRKINESPIKKAGLQVRKIARGSIRRGNLKGKGKGNPFERAKSERKPSKAGKPPKSWGRGKSPPFKMIYSVPNRLGTSAVVGMIGFGGSNPVPGLMEHGGTARRRVFQETKVFKHKHTRKSSGKYAKHSIRRKPMIKTVRYPERPFMFPALMKAKDRMPQLWKGSLKGRS